MNRIYQGRVSGVTLATAKNEFTPLATDPKEARRIGEEALFANSVKLN
jgi:hypothetical protein